MSKEEIVARVLAAHQVHFRVSYDAMFGQVWECSHRECHVAGTIEHVFDHVAEEIVKALP